MHASIKFPLSYRDRGKGRRCIVFSHYAISRRIIEFVGWWTIGTVYWYVSYLFWCFSWRWGSCHFEHTLLSQYCSQYFRIWQFILQGVIGHVPSADTRSVVRTSHSCEHMHHGCHSWCWACLWHRLLINCCWFLPSCKIHAVAPKHDMPQSGLCASLRFVILSHHICCLELRVRSWREGILWGEAHATLAITTERPAHLVVIHVNSVECNGSDSRGVHYCWQCVSVPQCHPVTDHLPMSQCSTHVSHSAPSLQYTLAAMFSMRVKRTYMQWRCHERIVLNTRCRVPSVSFGAPSNNSTQVLHEAHAIFSQHCVKARLHHRTMPKRGQHDWEIQCLQ